MTSYDDWLEEPYQRMYAEADRIVAATEDAAEELERQFLRSVWRFMLLLNPDPQRDGYLGRDVAWLREMCKDMLAERDEPYDGTMPSIEAVRAVMAEAAHEVHHGDTLTEIVAESMP